MGSTSRKKRATKRERRDSTLPEGHGARVLDRLLLLEHVIPPGEVLQVLEDTGCLDARRCTLTFEVTPVGGFGIVSLRELAACCGRDTSLERSHARAT